MDTETISRVLLFAGYGIPLWLMLCVMVWTYRHRDSARWQ